VQFVLVASSATVSSPLMASSLDGSTLDQAYFNKLPFRLAA
jgi:hypothetical protein